MTDQQRNLSWERPRMRSLIRLAIRHHKERSVVKVIGQGWPKDWLKGVFEEVVGGQTVAWDYDEPSGELWIKKMQF